MEPEFSIDATFCKYDASMGLVLGWAIVCKDKGVPYFDVQGDHIPEDAMLKAAADFMMNSRAADDMHDNVDHGSIVFAFPLTAETKKAFGINCPRTGLMIAMKPSDEILSKFKSGEYTGFSIGGARVKDEHVTDIETFKRGG